MKDFYYILGTRNNCTANELNEAYHKLAGRFNAKDDYFLQSHFQEISEAYEILSDPVKRRRYDAALKRSQKRQLLFFRTRHLNLLTTIALVGFTGLFGFYVLKQINQHKETPVQIIQPITSTATPHKRLKHRKKKHWVALTPATQKPVQNVISKSAVVLQVPVQKAIAAVQNTTPAPTAIKPVMVQSVPKPQPDTTYITHLKSTLAGDVYLHETADYMSAVVATLPAQAKVRVLAKGTTFYKVVYNSQTGYLPKWTLTTP